MSLRGMAPFLCVFAVVGALVAPARANVGPEWWGGYGTEPTGGVKDIAITRETLELDLRPLKEGKPVRIDATYHLNNLGGRQTLRLVFVAGTNEISDFTVTINNRSVACHRLPDKVDEYWTEPRWKGDPSHPLSATKRPSFPAFNESAMQSQVPIGGHYPLALVAFSVEFPPGRSTLRASYATKAVGTDETYPTATWHVPYVLAPARAWRGFGKLDVTVHLPDGWESLSSPWMERQGNELRRSFDGLPDDVLVVSARLPVGPEHDRRVAQYTAVYFLIVAAGGVLCAAWGWLVGRWSSRRPHGGIRLGLRLSIPCTGPMWAVFVYGATWLAMEGIRGPLALQESPYYHEHFHLPAIGSFLVGCLAIPLGIGLTSGVAVLSGRRTA